MTAGGWEAALDAFEERVSAQWTALEEGTPDAIAPFEPPGLDAALPEALVARATELVWRCRALEESLQAALNDAQEQLERVSQTTPPKPPAQPMYFDSRV